MRKSFIAGMLVFGLMVGIPFAPDLSPVGIVEASHSPETEDRDKQCSGLEEAGVRDLVCAEAYAHLHDTGQGWYRVRGDGEGWSPANIPGQLIVNSNWHTPESCHFIGSLGCKMTLPHEDVGADYIVVTATACLFIQDIILEVLEEGLPPLELATVLAEIVDLSAGGTICAIAEASVQSPYTLGGLLP